MDAEQTQVNLRLFERAVAFTFCLIWLLPLGRVLGAPALPSIPAGVFYITNYGAIGDGIVTNSSAIQAALDAAGAAGGGTVEVTAPGVFLCGPLAMHGHTRFKIDAGATLRLLSYGKYPGYVGGSQNDVFLELDRHGSDFELSGPGLLDGQGQPWWNANLTEAQRPYEVHMRDVSKVFIHDWNSANPPMKHIVMDGHNDNITIQNTTNTSPYFSPSQNTDGINLLGTHCLVQNCKLISSDDNIAMGRSTGECIDVLITNVTCGTGHGISFGSKLPPGGVSNVTVIDCTFSGTDNGIRFKSDTNLANGCVLQNVQFLNIGMTNVTRPIIMYSYCSEYGSPDNITPATAAAMPIPPAGTDTPIWRDIIISNVWGSGSGMSGIIWGRRELCVSNVTLQNINLTAPTTFNLYNAQGVQFVDCKFTLSSGNIPTYTMYNAELTVTNSSPPGLRPVTFDGLTVTTDQTSNTLSIYNAQAGLTKTNVLGTQPRLTIGSSILQVTNHLTLAPPSVLNLFLGTNAATVGVRSNLTLAGTVNVTDGGGLTNGSYVIFTNGGSLTWGGPVIGSTPAGVECVFDSNTPGQVRLIVSVPTKLAMFGPQFVSGGFSVSFSGQRGQTYKLLTSTNVTLPMDAWIVLTNGTFPVPGPFIDTSATYDRAKFYRLTSP